jgi:hypothetical protein
MRTTIVLAALAVGAAAIGIGIAPPAAADPSSNCQTIGASTVCGQGGITGGGGASAAPGGGAAPSGGGCVNAYGGYQNCNVK